MDRWTKQTRYASSKYQQSNRKGHFLTMILFYRRCKCHMLYILSFHQGYRIGSHTLPLPSLLDPIDPVPNPRLHTFSSFHNLHRIFIYCQPLSYSVFINKHQWRNTMFWSLVIASTISCHTRYPRQIDSTIQIPPDTKTKIKRVPSRPTVPFFLFFLCQNVDSRSSK
jgi:hypothetical protein